MPATAHFTSIRLANLIVSNEIDWFWDNCRVSQSGLSTAGLASVIEPYLPKPDHEVLKAWNQAVYEANGAAVDGLVKWNTTAYCITCFRNHLSAQRKEV